MSDPRTLDPRFIAGVDLIKRTGAKSFRVGWSDESEGLPVVWYAVGTWPTEHEASDCAAALDPITAVMRLCEQVIDGGTCRHCGRLTIFDPAPADSLVDDMLDQMGCRYAYDDDRAEFLRSCQSATDR